ncbi:MAG: Hsp70 family protein, partial [Pseudomonadota bacterium]|nr:Hsp70 family protein [Pseudomonadota bacterium]
ERDVASGNKSLGQFNLTDIPPAPRGMPQIEVTFNIDANGILNVSAKDKATGKENKITIKASSGLSEEEIQRMVHDAEAHAAEDREALELVNARNQGDALVHAVKKTLAEGADKLNNSDKTAVEAALKDLEEALKGNSLDDIKTKTEALSKASAGLAEQMYKGDSGASAEADSGKDDHVVDAEFEEVKDEKR